MLRTKSEEAEQQRIAAFEWQSKYNQLEASNSRFSLESSRKVNEQVQNIALLRS